MPTRAEMNGQAHNVVRRLEDITDQRDAAIDVAQKGAELAVNILETSSTASLEGDDIRALYAVLPDLRESRDRIYGRRSWGTAEFIGPVSKPQGISVIHFAGGLLLAADAWEHTILGQVNGIDFRVDPGATREEAADAYCEGHMLARGSRPSLVGLVSS